ncbi:NB-ARC domain-containing protein, partial [Actinoplanes sp. NPDC049118]|uniref:NB-ARC domain-containing protein n=1 Tax=Actinoplanes sp. NPDC049118 TaxID=3155769 RepID=UPI0033FF7285
MIAAASAATLVAVAVNVATGGSAPWFPAVEQRPLWWAGFGTAGTAVAGLAGSWAQRLIEHQLPMVPAEQRPESWIIERPVEVDRIVEGLRRRGSRTVGVTTALQGAGGFGKTTVAKLVRSDRRILRRFGDHVYWVTLGRDVRRGTLTDKVNDLIQAIDPDRQASFTDAQQAGQYLSALLRAGPPRLLVLDDVWFPEQLEAFPLAGRSARLITTRNASLVGGDAASVRVDQLSLMQARAVLLADLPDLPAHIVGDVLDETGRWPLLLRLINRVLVNQARLHTDLAAAGQQLLDRLRRDGMSQVDNLTGAAGQELDVNDPRQRQHAIAATVDASIGLLRPPDRVRLAELSVFAEDESIPVLMVAGLWNATDGLDGVATRALCARLEDLSLISLTPTADGGAFSLHDVIREVLRRELGSERLRALHHLLLAAAAGQGPAASDMSADGDAPAVEWWSLPELHPYLQDHLIEHLQAAGRSREAAALACDVRWVTARLEQSGAVAPLSDLALIPGPTAAHLRRLFGQTSHLLTPTDPPHCRVDILYARLEHDAVWGAQVRTLSRERRSLALLNDWPLPDLPEPALRRTITGHTAPVRAIAISPDSGWLVTASADRSVRLWNASTGAERLALTGHTDRVNAVAIAADGTWLATAGADRSIRTWDATTGALRAKLTGHKAQVNAVAIAPDGTWLASAGDDLSVRIWDVSTGAQRAKLTGHSDRVTSVVIDPGSGWVATTSDDRSVRVWDVTTGREQRRLVISTDWVRSVAIAPSGTWLAVAGWSLRIWNPNTEEQRTDFISRFDELLNAIAISPDETWLASAGDDRTVKIWNVATGEEQALLQGHIDPVNAVNIAPDGTWLATASSDWSVRVWDAVANPNPGRGKADRAYAGGRSIGERSKWYFDVAWSLDGEWLATGSTDSSVQFWNAATGEQRHNSVDQAGRTGRVNAVAISPDGTWSATAGWSVRIWDAKREVQRTEILGHIGRVFAVAIASNGTYLATGGDDRTVRIWDAVTGAERRTLVGHADRVNSVAVAPDGSWLASASSDRTVRIWDAVTGAERRTLVGHADRVNSVAVAPDGSWLASAS